MNQCKKCGGKMFVHGAVACPIFGAGFSRGAGWTCEKCDHYVPYQKELDTRVLKNAS